MRRIAALVVAAGLGMSARQAATPWDRVEAVFHQRSRDAGIAGAGLLLVKNGSVSHAAFEGYQDLVAKRPVDADTIYHWASITKTLTGVAIMQLRDRGLLSLDDPIVKYVPELRQVHDRFGDIAAVKVRHLMSHSGGFRASTWPWGGDQPWHPFEPTRCDQVVALFQYTDARCNPSTR